MTSIRVLVVCTGNSARSVMAEALLRTRGGEAFEVHSAGTEPKGINPLTVRVLEEAGIDASWARSKSVQEYLGQSFDYVITVCDEARQACPVFPGVHESLHWGYEDPALATGSGGGAAGRLPTGLHPARGAHRHVHPARATGTRRRRDDGRARDLAPMSDPIQLYLLRHAHAGDPAEWDGPDDQRPLSPKGERQSDRLGRFLAGIGFEPDAIITSPKVRAARTAEIVAEPLGLAVRVDERLGGGVGVSALEAILTDAGNPVRPVLVGHDPDFSELVETLSGGNVPMRKGALARIDSGRPLRPGAGELRWLVPPDLLKPSAGA